MTAFVSRAPVESQVRIAMLALGLAGVISTPRSVPS